MSSPAKFDLDLDFHSFQMYCLHKQLQRHGHILCTAHHPATYYKLCSYAFANRVKDYESLWQKNKATIATFCEFHKAVYPEKLAMKNSDNNYFITINYKPGTKIEHAQNSMLRVVTKKWIVHYYYCFEQRGSDLETVGSGLHTHLLVVDSPQSKPSHVLREIYNSVKQIVGSRSAVDVRKVPHSWVADKIKYMSGDKWDSEKLPKVEMDRVFRKKYSLLDIYTNQNAIQEKLSQKEISEKNSSSPSCENRVSC